MCREILRKSWKLRNLSCKIIHVTFFMFNVLQNMNVKSKILVWRPCLYVVYQSETQPTHRVIKSVVHRPVKSSDSTSMMKRMRKRDVLAFKRKSTDPVVTLLKVCDYEGISRVVTLGCQGRGNCLRLPDPFYSYNKDEVAFCTRIQSLETILSRLKLLLESRRFFGLLFLSS